MIKKAVIAAAGEGTRMLHLTNKKSKHLIKVKGRPFLAYLLDNLFRAGYRQIFLVTGYKEELIEEFLREYKPPIKKLRESQYKIKIISQYNILGPKEKIYGTACPLMCAKKVLRKQPFVYLCGDNLYSADDLKAMGKRDKYCRVAGTWRKHPEKYGVLVEENGFLKEIVEKPKKFISNLVNTGLYKFTPDVFGKLNKIKESPRGEYEITDVINLLAKQKKVKVKRIKDFWVDFGNPADIIQVSYLLKSFKKFKKLFWRSKRFEVISAKSPAAVDKAVDCLNGGQVIVCPTDTVYGLLADATNKEAVEKVFQIKKRNKKKAISVFVKDVDMAKKYAKMDREMKMFLEEIWPGKITVALLRKRNTDLSKLIYAKKKTIGLRIPDNKLVGDILNKFKRPLTGTSANISGRPSALRLEDVFRYFEDQELRPGLILSGGNLPYSNPSTVVDFSKDRPKIIRRGK